MLHHVKEVRRGAERAMVIADMPFILYQVSREEAVRNAGRFMKEAGADAVKLEGGFAIAPTLRAVHEAGNAAIGHVGLTPQSAGQLGGLKVQSLDVATTIRLIDEALALQEAGAFAVILEAVTGSCRLGDISLDGADDQLRCGGSM